MTNNARIILYERILNALAKTHRDSAVLRAHSVLRQRDQAAANEHYDARNRLNMRHRAERSRTTMPRGWNLYDAHVRVALARRRQASHAAHFAWRSRQQAS